MNRSALIGSGAVATIVAGGILAVGSAQAAGGSHTLHLRSHRLQVANTSKATFAETNVVTKSGKTVGYETLSCNDGGTGVKCSLSLSLPNGMLLGGVTTPITTSDQTTLTGKITGGLGAFVGVKGTVTADVTGKNANYTITYHS
jgi:hypothetical protein